MNTAIIVQARMNSSRLPGKVLAPLGGRPMLAQQLRRLRQCAAYQIVVATTVHSADDPIAELARREKASCFRGSEEDVLSRYVAAARQVQAQIIVRVTADCPLIDATVIDRVIRDLVAHRGQCDYAANILERTYPRGLDVEAFWWDTLMRMDRLGRSAAAREHVTVVARAERPELFLCRSVIDREDNSDLRWTVDTERDLETVRAIYAGLGLEDRIASYQETLAYVRAHTEVSDRNRGIETWDPNEEFAHSG